LKGYSEAQEYRGVLVLLIVQILNFVGVVQRLRRQVFPTR